MVLISVSTICPIKDFATYLFNTGSWKLPSVKVKCIVIGKISSAKAGNIESMYENEDLNF